MWNSVLAILLEFLQQKTEKVRSKNENHKKIRFSQKNSIKLFLGHVEYSFHSRTLFASRPKWTGKSYFFQEILLKFYLPTGKMHFSRPSRKTLAGRPSFFLSRSTKEMKTYKNFSKLFFLEVFLRTRRIHYWQPHWKEIDKQPEFFCSVSEEERRKLRAFWGKYVFQTVPVNT